MNPQDAEQNNESNANNDAAYRPDRKWDFKHVRMMRQVFEHAKELFYLFHFYQNGIGKDSKIFNLFSKTQTST